MTDSPDGRRPPESAEVVLVAAVAENGVIGRNGGMPWHYPADLRQFKQTTTGHPVVMGRRTYESIADRLGGPLPDRPSIVLTRDPAALSVPEEVVVVDGVEAALSAAGSRDDVVYVVGGATVYEAFLPRADRMRLTRVPESPDGDTHFPEWDTDEWRETNRGPLGDDGLKLVEYERRRDQ
jgi:dihydrofolate reductase